MQILTTESVPQLLPSDPLEAALEASCDALIALQALCHAVPDDWSLARPTTRAIQLLRGAIEELRAARGEWATPLSRGFVLCSKDPSRPEPGVEPGHAAGAEEL